MDCARVKQIVLRVLRDNVLNSMFLTVLVAHLTGQCYDWTLAWFLPALLTCRLGIEFGFHFTSRLGECNGSIVLVAGAFIAPYLLRVKFIVLPIPVCLGLEPCLVSGALCWEISQRITSSWVFYCLGFLTDPKLASVCLKTRTATCFAIVAIGVVCCAKHHGIVQVSDVLVPYSRPGLYSMATYLHDTFAKLFCSVLFLACLAPLACTGGLMTQVFAQLGQRTLTAYWLLMFLFGLHRASIPALFVLQSEDSDSMSAVVISFITIILVTSVACCPLTEWTLGCLTSPQWIFDGSSKAILWLRGQRPT